MNHPFNSQAKVWILFTEYLEYNLTFEYLYEVFDTPETCFEKYPGDWKKETEELYYFFHPINIEKFRSCYSIFLKPYSFITKKS